MRKMLNNKVLMGLLLLLLIAAVCLLPFPKNIDITQSAILWRSWIRFALSISGSSSGLII